MLVTVIGAGASGLFLSLYLKILNKNIDILLIEKNNEIGKKLKATGNGRCNLGNLKINKDSYNNSFINIEINNSLIPELIYIYHSLGIETRIVNNLIYPYNLEAKRLVELFNYKIKKNNIDLRLNEKFIKYELSDNKTIIYTDKNKYITDYLVFSNGGITYPKLGATDESIFNYLSLRGYKIEPLRKGLSPIKIKENIKCLENLRVKCLASLLIDNKEIYIEEGEVIFKKDALSGICIFNISSLINRKINKYRNKKITIKLNLFPNINIKYIDKSQIYSLFSNELIKYLNIDLDSLNETSFKNILSKCQNLLFTYKKHYDSNYSQVSIGGVSLDNIDKYNFQSKKEKHIYFIGEILDIDGLSGGYNLMFALYSALKVSESIVNNL